MLFVICVLKSSVFVPATHAQPNEYLLKAVYFEKFTRFTEWPLESNVNDKKVPFVITIIGENPFNGLLEEVYKEQKISNKEVIIKYIETVEEINKPNILFISGIDDSELDKVLALTSKQPILTIGENKGYAQKGVLINFFIENNKIRFEINESAVRNAGLIMDFRLLSFARVVKSAN